MKQTDVYVLIVDDQNDRIPVYLACIAKVNEVLGGKWNLIPHCCSEIAAITKLTPDQNAAKLAIIDMVLDAPGWTSRNVHQLDQKILSEGWPLVLVSGRFESPQAMERANNLISGLSATASMSQFLLWSWISRAAEGLEVPELAFIIDSVLSRVKGQDIRLKKAANENIGVLHVTDPHFGQAKWDVGSLMSLRVQLGLRNLGAADFLAITGDIANEGKPSEYGAALEYFRALATNNLVARTETGLPADRVMVCPGNHDFSRVIALGANIVAGDEYTVGHSITSGNGWVRSYAWSAYEEFEKVITGRTTGNSRWIPEPGFRVNSRFSNFGIVFLELNVEPYSISGYQDGIGESEFANSLNSAATAISEIRKSHECLVVLAHRNPKDQWKDVEQRVARTLVGLSSAGPVILLCGHEHAMKVAAEFDEKVLLVQGIPPTAGPSRPALVLPVVNYINLLREGGHVIAADVHSFHQESTAWLAAGTHGKRYSWKDGRWWPTPHG